MRFENEEKERERLFQLRIKEIEFNEKSKSKSLSSDTSKIFDVTKHIRLVPPFQEKEVDKYFLHFEKVAENLKWPKEHWTLLLQSVVIGKAREIYTKLSLEQSSDYDTVKEFILRLMSWSLRHTGRNLETVEKNMTRLMLSLLEQKSNYLIDGVLQRK